MIDLLGRSSRSSLQVSPGQKQAWDIAIMLPILEMAGYNRSKYISEKLYVYNQETPHNDYKLYAKQSAMDAECIMSKPAYQCRESF